MSHELEVQTTPDPHGSKERVMFQCRMISGTGQGGTARGETQHEARPLSAGPRFRKCRDDWVRNEWQKGLLRIYSTKCRSCRSPFRNTAMLDALAGGIEHVTCGPGTLQGVQILLWILASKKYKTITVSVCSFETWRPSQFPESFSKKLHACPPKRRPPENTAWHLSHQRIRRERTT